MNIPFHTLSRPSARRRAAALSALAVVGAFSLAACGEDEAPEASASDGASTQSTEPRDRVPGVSGKVAAVSGDVAQVQGSDGQVAVALGDAAVTTQGSGSLDDVTKGSCVVVSFDRSDGADSKAEDTPATEVSISDPVGGECSGFGGGPGGPGAGERPEMPEGAEPPGDGERPEMPEGAEPPGDGERPDGERPQGGMPGGDRVMGTVTAVTSKGFTVEVAARPTPPGGASESADSKQDPDEAEISERTVVVDGDTTYSRTVAGSASDVTEGRCVMATGEEDETGGLKAETVHVTDAVDGECTPGFGRGSRGGDR